MQFWTIMFPYKKFVTERKYVYLNKLKFPIFQCFFYPLIDYLDSWYILHIAYLVQTSQKQHKLWASKKFRLLAVSLLYSLFFFLFSLLKYSLRFTVFLNQEEVLLLVFQTECLLQKQLKLGLERTIQLICILSHTIFMSQLNGKNWLYLILLKNILWMNTKTLCIYYMQ